MVGNHSQKRAAVLSVLLTLFISSPSWALHPMVTEPSVIPLSLERQQSLNTSSAADSADSAFAETAFFKRLHQLLPAQRGDDRTHTLLPRAESRARLAPGQSAIKPLKAPRPALAGHKQNLQVNSAYPEPAAADAVSAVEAADLDVYYRASGTPRFMRARKTVGAKRPALHAGSVTRNLKSGQRSDVATARSFLRQYHAYLRMNDTDNELQLLTEQSDPLQQRHLAFAQQYQGLPVWPARLMVHTSANGDVTSLSGATIPTPEQLSIDPLIDADTAQQRAYGALQVSGSRSRLMPQLIIYAPADSEARLAWKCAVNVSMHEHQWVLVDARDASILDHWNTLPHATAATGSGVDLFGVTQTLQLWQDDKGVFNMVNTSTPMYTGVADPLLARTQGVITVRDARNQPPNSDPQTTPISYIVSNASASGKWLSDGVSAATNLATVYNYYRDRHGRNSIDGKGSAIVGVVRLGRGYDNAYYDPGVNTMFFGDAQKYAGALDVVGHELTHGVTSYSADLIYQRQSGALNEAVSDIFGEMIQAYATGSTDWVVSAQLGEPFRILKNPNALDAYPGKPYPADMSQYVKTSDDDGGVHTNSTIISYAYYLLAQGATGAIGIPAAEKILYRALTQYMTPSSQFVDARLTSLQAAEDLYGAGSVQVQKVAEAFDKVGIVAATGGSGSGGSTSGGGSSQDNPPPLPVINGDDNTLFLAVDKKAVYLGRRDEALGDPVEGVFLSNGPADWVRPSVSRDGATAVFVSADGDACWIPTDGSANETCMGMRGMVYSVAISPDGNKLAFVMRDRLGNPKAEITVSDLETGKDVVYKLVAPTTAKDHDVNSISHADAMTFTSDGHYLVYDAENLLPLPDGSKQGAYSIYALDMSSEATGTLVLVPPQMDSDIGNPSASHNDPALLTYESEDKSTKQSTLYVTHLGTGDTTPVTTIQDLGFPAFSGDDAAIVYTLSDTASSTGGSLWRIAIPDQKLPNPVSELWLNDADMGVIYRRANWQNLALSFKGKGSGRVTSIPEGMDCTAACTARYDNGVSVKLSAVPNTGSKFAGWQGACTSLNSSCDVLMDKDRALIAQFDTLPGNELSVKFGGFGKGSVHLQPGDITCNTNCVNSFPVNTTVTLTPSANAGSVFMGWSGACSGTKSCIVKLSLARSVTARFNRLAVKK